MRGHGREEVVVHRRVGVFLRIQHPDQDIDQAHHALHNRAVGRPGGVEVRQVQQDQPRTLVREAGNGNGMVAVAHLQPVQQRLAAVRAPDTCQRFRRGGPAGRRRRDFSAADRVEQ